MTDQAAKKKPHPWRVYMPGWLSYRKPQTPHGQVKKS